LGDAASAEGDFKTATEEVRQAHCQFERLNDPDGRALVALKLASIWVQQGQSAAARRLAHESLRLFDETGQRTARAYPLLTLAEIDIVDGQDEAAEALIQEAMQIFTE